MDIKSTATYPYPIWGLYDDYKGELPSGHRKDFRKDITEDVFVLEYEVTSHNDGVDRLIKEGLAAYLCIVQCSSTYYTQIDQIVDPSFTIKIPCSKVNKRFSVKIEIVAIRPIVECDFLDVNDFYEGVVDYQKGAMISLIDKFNISLTPSDGMANLGRIVKYEFANVDKVMTRFSNIIIIRLPYSYENVCNPVMTQCPNVFEATFVRNALVEAVYQLRKEPKDDVNDWAFYLKQFINNMVMDGDIPENSDYDYELDSILRIVDKILPEVMLNALEDVKSRIEPTTN